MPILAPLVQVVDFGKDTPMEVCRPALLTGCPRPALPQCRKEVTRELSSGRIGCRGGWRR